MKKTFSILCITLFSVLIYAQSVEDRARMAYYEAEEAFNNGNFDLCVSELKKAERLMGTTNPKILELKTKAYYNSNNMLLAYNSKNDFFEIAASDYPGYENILRISRKIDKKAFNLSLAESGKHLKNGIPDAFPHNLKAALPYLIKCIEIEPHNSKINSQLGQIYYKLRDFENATTHLQKALENDISNRDRIYLSDLLTVSSSKDPEKVKIAKQRITELEKEIKKDVELAAYNNAKTTNTISAYYQFLQHYPKSNYYNEINSLKTKLEDKINDEKEINNLIKDGFTDKRDNNHYKVVKIGDQIWMAENLRYEYGPNFGSKIKWYLMDPWKRAHCWYDKNPAYAKKYGAMYTYEAAVNACPDGWKLPSEDDWIELIDEAKKYGNAAEVLKSKQGWESIGSFNAIGFTPSSGKSYNGMDLFGFSALPGGARINNGGFVGLGKFAKFWTSTYYTNTFDAIRFAIESDNTTAFDRFDKRYGYSVRCIKK